MSSRIAKWVSMLAGLTLFVVPGFAATSTESLNDTPSTIYSPRSWACYQTGVLPVDVVTSDFNADGWLDIAVLNIATGQVNLWENGAILGRGAFTNSAFVPAGLQRFSQGSQLALSDKGTHVLYKSYEGNSSLLGLVDAVTGSRLPDTVIPKDVIGLVSSDFDHDLDLDLILLRQLGIEDQLGNFYPLPAAPVAGAAANLNGDAWIDLIILLSDGQVIPFYGQQTLAQDSFVQGISILETDVQLPKDISVGDFNADGETDFVVVGNSLPDSGHGVRDGFAQVFLNTVSQTADASFLPAGVPMRTWGFNACAVEILDVDNNGTDDFIVANFDSPTVTIFLADAQEIHTLADEEDIPNA